MKDVDEQAAALVAALVPIMQPVVAHRLQRMRATALAAARPPVVAKPRPAPPRDALTMAAGAVAVAVDRLERAKFGPEEGPAMAALVKRAVALRALVRGTR